MRTTAFGAFLLVFGLGSPAVWAQSTAVIVVETPTDAGVPTVGDIQWKLVEDLEEVKAIPTATLSDRGITDARMYATPTWNAATAARFQQKLDVATDRYSSRDLVEAHRLLRLITAELDKTSWVPNAFIVTVYEWQVAALIAQNLPIKASVPARAVIALSPNHQVDLGVFNPEVAEVIEQAKAGPMVSFGMATAPAATLVTLNGRPFMNKVRQANVMHRFVITKNSYEPVEVLVRGDTNHPALKVQLPLRIKPALRESLVEAIQRGKPAHAEDALAEISRLTGAARVVIVGATAAANGAYTTSGFAWTADAEPQKLVSGTRSNLSAALRRQIRKMPVVVAPQPTPVPAGPVSWVVTSEAGAGVVNLYRRARGRGGAKIHGDDDFRPVGPGISISTTAQRGNLGVEGRFSLESFDFFTVAPRNTSPNPDPGQPPPGKFTLGRAFSASGGGVYSRAPLSLHFGGFWRRHFRAAGDDDTLELGVEYEYFGLQTGVSFRIGPEDARFVTNVGALGRLGSWTELHGRNQSPPLDDSVNLGLGYSVYAASTVQIGGGFEVSARLEFEYRSVQFTGPADGVEATPTIEDVNFQEYSPGLLVFLRRSFN